MLSLNVKEGFYQSKILSDYIKNKKHSIKFYFSSNSYNINNSKKLQKF